MTRIRQLEATVVNKIAAGEVIERPASVVKELLENSVDALAMRIDVDVAAGGSDMIRVVDDGEGIHADDLLLTVESHATSKIRTSDDLFSVQTMGFRGEALASIASVSQFQIRSRQSDHDSGVELEVRGGRVGQVRPCGCSKGTQIEVRQLFGNTPVRRKFLKTTATEFGHISEQFTRVALANPRLAMTLRHNNKIVYQLPPCDGMLDRLRLFFGAEVSEKLIWVESEMPVGPTQSDDSGDEQPDVIRIWGYVAHPSFSKSTRKSQYLFLNGRWIQDRSLQHALTEAYRGLLMVGRHPVVFLFLEMPSSLVDVNVHPSKWEVRFRDSQQLYRQMLSMIRTQFLGMELSSQFKLPPSGSESDPARSTEAVRQLKLDEPHRAWSPMNSADSKRTAPTLDSPAVTLQVGSGEETCERSYNVVGGSSDFTCKPAPRTSEPTGQEARGILDSEAKESNSRLGTGGQSYSAVYRAIQIHDCYLVVPTEQGLEVIDQHALHERILYEYLKRRILEDRIDTQRLLVPQTITLSGAELSVIQEHAAFFKELGFEVEDFGGGTVAVHSYPVMIRKQDVALIVRDLTEQILQSGQKVTKRDVVDEVLTMMSCKAAIKSGQRLSAEEIDELLEQKHLVDDSHHCPHGRPTALVLSREMLDRQFGRLG